jgi:cell division protein FtsN
VTLGAATAVFSGVLFAAGYWVGQRQRVESTAGSGDLARLDAARRPNRASPGSSAPVAALGDVEFLFPSVVAAGPSRGGPEQVPVHVPAIVMQPSNDERGASAPVEPAVREEGTPGPKALAAATPGPSPAPSPPDEDEGRVDGPVTPLTPPRVEVAPIPPPPDEDEPRPLPSLGGATAAPKSAAPAPAPAAPKAERDPRSAAGGAYTLQVKAVKDKAEADEFVARVRAAGLEPSVIIADVPGKGRVYRVRVGRFESMESAKRFQREFKDRTGLPEAGFVTDL